MKDKENGPSYEQVLADIIKRDHDDSTRAIAPLKQAEDAVLLDTTSLDLEQSVKAVMDLVKKAVG